MEYGWIDEWGLVDMSFYEKIMKESNVLDLEN